MKKQFTQFIAILLVLLQVFGLCSCTNKTKKTKYNAYYFDYFDTETTITGYTETKEEFDNICKEIEALLEEYHRLFNIYTRYDGLNNLVTINDVKDGTHQTVKVDLKIIEMLTFSKEMYQKTNGKVNIAMNIERKK